jgi:hypothetical protein
LIAANQAKLLDQIKATHTKSDATYGMPCIRAELADGGTVPVASALQL